MSLADWFNRSFEWPPSRTGYRPSEDIAKTLKTDSPPKPRLVSTAKAPSREAFAVWRDDPVTQFVFLALRNQQAECREAWSDLSWNGGIADQERLNELRARADTYAALEDSSYEGYCEAVGVDPEPEPNAA